MSGVLAGAIPDASSSRNGTASNANATRRETDVDQMRSVKIMDTSLAQTPGSRRGEERGVDGRVPHDATQSERPALSIVCVVVV
jgi:hypothetical protein